MTAARKSMSGIITPKPRRQEINAACRFLHQQKIRSLVLDQSFNLVDGGASKMQQIPTDDFHINPVRRATGDTLLIPQDFVPLPDLFPRRSRKARISKVMATQAAITPRG